MGAPRLTATLLLFCLATQVCRPRFRIRLCRSKLQACPRSPDLPVAVSEDPRFAGPKMCDVQGSSDRKLRRQSMLKRRVGHPRTATRLEPTHMLRLLEPSPLALLPLDARRRDNVHAGRTRLGVPKPPHHTAMATTTRLPELVNGASSVPAATRGSAVVGTQVLASTAKLKAPQVAQVLPCPTKTAPGRKTRPKTATTRRLVH